MAYKKSISSLQKIPGIGPSIEKDLFDLGIYSVEELCGKNPEDLYKQLCEIRNAHIDRCVLYVFRCAVYFATTSHPDPEKLKWWHWKDKKSELKK